MRVKNRLFYLHVTMMEFNDLNLVIKYYDKIIGKQRVAIGLLLFAIL